MAAQPVIYATEPYNDPASTIFCPPALVRGCEPMLLARALPAVERGDATLDLSNVKQMDAAGLGALVVLHQVAQQHGNTLRFINPSPRVRQLLTLTKLDSVFTR